MTERGPVGMEAAACIFVVLALGVVAYFTERRQYRKEKEESSRRIAERFRELGRSR